jgi:hypothetical protein
MLVTPRKPKDNVASTILSHYREYTGNPQGSLFDRTFAGYETEKTLKQIRNTIGQPANSITDTSESMGGVLGNYGPALGGYTGRINPQVVVDAVSDNQTQLYWRKNRERCKKYNTICTRSEIEEGLHHIISEAIDETSLGEICTLRIDPDSGITENKELADLNKIFRLDVMKDILNFKENARDWMFKLLVEGRLFFEVILDEASGQIVGVSRLPSENMIIAVQNGTIIGYRQMLVGDYGNPNPADNGKGYRDFDPKQILYCDLGEHFRGPGGINDPRSIMEAAIKPYHQLNTIEDSVVTYRILWGSEKLLFKIDTGDMPKHKAERHMKEQEKILSRRIDYDTTTGMISSPSNVIGLSEHFFVNTGERSKGTSIERMKGGENLGNVDDLKYFKKNLVSSLHVPDGRISSLSNGEEKYTSGKIGEVTQAEVAFARRVAGYVSPLGYVIRRLFVMVLMTKPWLSSERKKEMYYDVVFNKTNSFQEYIDMEILKARYEVLEAGNKFVRSKQNPDGFLPKEYVAVNALKIGQGEWGKLQEQLKHEEFDADNAAMADTAPMGGIM